ncbi:hypothetical protein GCM10023093_11520 [Nemorincola caseinilytica]|uniref:Uncharacterized protein n=1 Tax=Nemorincola caseinilytica TaxID=2054315 RepID=A0ABP8NCK7_9BACT
MVLVLKRGATEKEILSIRKKLQKKKGQKGGVDLSRHFGTIKLKVDPMDIQRKLRDEWE